MMKYLKTIILLIFCNSYLSSQISVQGVVLGSGDNDPLFGVNISVKETRIGTTTDINGDFESDLEGSNSLLAFQYEGYQLKEYNATGSVKGLEIQLQSDIYQKPKKNQNIISQADFPFRTKNSSSELVDYFPSVVRITAHKGFGEDIGAGIIIGKEGQETYILTALHVVSESTKNEILIYKQKTTHSAEVVLENEPLDLVVLKIKTKAIHNNKVFHPIFSNHFQNKVAVKSIGHPGGGFWKLNTLNKVQETELYEEKRKFSITPLAIVGGCSGGPVFADNGAWLGLITETSMIEGRCVKANIIQKWIRKNSIPNQFIYYPSMEMIFVKGKQGNGEYVIKNRPTQLEGDLEISNSFRQEGKFNPRKVKNFYLAKNELSVADFEAFVMATGYLTDNEKQNKALVLEELKIDNEIVEGIWDFDNTTNVNWRHDEFGKLISNINKPKYPVVHLSWNDAKAYCQWLISITNQKYRLPSQEELLYVQLPKKSSSFEYALKENVFDQSLCDFGFSLRGNSIGNPCEYWRSCENKKPYNDGFKSLSPLGQFPSNYLGFNDLFGNVSEWCEESYEADEPIYFGANWLTSTLEYLIAYEQNYFDRNQQVYVSKCYYLMTNEYLTNDLPPAMDIGYMLRPRELNFNVFLGVDEEDILEYDISSNFIGIRLARN